MCSCQTSHSLLWRPVKRNNRLYACALQSFWGLMSLVLWLMKLKEMRQQQASMWKTFSSLIVCERHPVLFQAGFLVADKLHLWEKALGLFKLLVQSGSNSKPGFFPISERSVHSKCFRPWLPVGSKAVLLLPVKSNYCKQSGVEGGRWRCSPIGWISAVFDLNAKRRQFCQTFFSLFKHSLSFYNPLLLSLSVFVCHSKSLWTPTPHTHPTSPQWRESWSVEPQLCSLSLIFLFKTLFVGVGGQEEFALRAFFVFKPTLSPFGRVSFVYMCVCVCAFKEW